MAASSSYSKLPTELLSRVAELVHEQDLAFVKLLEDDSIRRVTLPLGPHQRANESNAEPGIWSYWYDRGVSVMATVDRVTRAAALPYLYQSITSKQTHSAWFRCEVLGRGLGQHVRHLEADEARYETHLARLHRSRSTARKSSTSTTRLGHPARPRQPQQARGRPHHGRQARPLAPVLRLPSVRSYILETGLPYGEDLAFAHLIAPLITHLTIRNPTTAHEIGVDAIELPSPLLPTLRTLVLDLDRYRDDFHEITLPGLEHYHVHYGFKYSTFPLGLDEVPFKSPFLRTITVSHRPVHLGEPHTTLHDTCAAAGVRLVVQTHPITQKDPTDADSFAVDPRSDPSGRPATRRADKPKQLFDWAARRAQWLCDVDDEAGLQELAEAAERLQERFVLDDS